MLLYPSNMLSIFHYLNRYTTVHLKDETTPQSVKNLLANWRKDEHDVCCRINDLYICDIYCKRAICILFWAQNNQSRIAVQKKTGSLYWYKHFIFLWRIHVRFYLLLPLMYVFFATQQHRLFNFSVQFAMQTVLPDRYLPFIGVLCYSW